MVQTGHHRANDRISNNSSSRKAGSFPQWSSLQIRVAFAILILTILTGEGLSLSLSPSSTSSSMTSLSGSSASPILMSSRKKVRSEKALPKSTRTIIPISVAESAPLPSSVVQIPEAIWRKAASDHRIRIRQLLEPGLVDFDHPLMAPVRKNFLAAEYHTQEENMKWMTILDPKHPVYNFLVEYYGLKGLKGPKRLARWSPSIGLFFWKKKQDNKETGTTDQSTKIQRIQSLYEYYEASKSYQNNDGVLQENSTIDDDRGVFLEGATPDDFALTLYLQGAEWIPGEENINKNGQEEDPVFGGMEGVLYRPIRLYGSQSTAKDNVATIEDTQETEMARKKASSFLWYKSILQTTLVNEPVLHCYGLHEWAMQYHPEGAPPPPSGKYQAHLPLRVSRQTINETIERKGLRCTHVDALRFFAPAAGPLNQHGASLERQQQLDLEQKACVHSHMDLLKIALRLRPYCDPVLLTQVLEIGLEARSLDVGASPYDCSAYSTTQNRIPTIRVETAEGRSQYKQLQARLMDKAEPIRKQLLANYEAFMGLAFEDNQLVLAATNPSDEQFATAQPGGLPWRKNLINQTTRETT